MRIASVTLEVLEMPFRTPLATAAGTWGQRRIGLVRVAADDGREGVGEVADDRPGGIERIDAGPLPAALAGIDVADEAALDERLDELEKSTDIARPLRSAAESAVLDLVARGAGRSIAECLAERPRSSVRVNGFLGIDTAARTADAARAHAAAGFTCLKLKAGHEPVETITQRVAAVRDAAGPTLGLRLDFNGALPPESAERTLEAMVGFDLEYVEQPISPAAGVEALARLRRVGAVPIAVDESVDGVASAARLLRSGAVDALVVKPARVGGLRSADRIARLAATTGVSVIISTMFETGIGIAGALQLAASLPDDQAHGLATLDLLREHLLVQPLSIEAGRMERPAGAGLGVELDAAAVERVRWR